MPGPVTLEALDLAALLCSRVCHDLISPVGAVVNGIEVMEDDADEQTKAFAIELIKKSATTASARLQFCRIAFGAAGLGRRRDRPRRCRGCGARHDGGRQDQAHLEPAARAVAEEPGQAAAQSAAAGRRDDPARRQPRDRAGRRGGHDGLQDHRDRPQCPHPAGGARAWWRARPEAIRSTPMRSSRSLPGCWRAPAG